MSTENTVETNEPSQITTSEAPTEQALQPATALPEPSRKGSSPFVIIALLVVIVGVAVALFIVNKDDSTVEETPPIQEIAEPEIAPPEPEAVTPTTTETAKPVSETPEPALRKLTRDEFEKLKALESDAMSSHEAAGEYYRHGDYANALVQYQNARNAFEQMLPYYRQSLGDGHDNTITVRKNLAAVYNALGDVCRNQKKYAEAMNWLNKSLEIREKFLGKDHPETAETYNNIALVYDGQGQYAKALEWYQKDLAVSEKTLGSNHPDTAKTYNNIGMVYFHQGNSASAMEWFKKALAIQENQQSYENPNAAMTYNNIAEVHRVQGNYTLALPEYLKAYRILLNAFGEESSTTKAVRLNLARAYDKTENSTPFAEWLEASLQ